MRGRTRVASLLNSLLMPPGGYIRSRLANGILMELDLTDRLQMRIHYLGAYEPVESALILEGLPAGGVFVDIGANVGTHTLVAARHLGEAGRVYAFEPFPPNVERLKRNIDLNGLKNTEVVAVALSDVSGGVAPMATRFTRSGNATLADRSDAAQVIEVPVMRFDDWASDKRLERIDVLKIDVEGAEERVLRGMSSTLQRLEIGRILFEVNPVMLEKLGSSQDSLAGHMISLGYELTEVLPGGGVRPFEGVPPGRVCVNILARKRPHPA